MNHVRPGCAGVPARMRRLRADGDCEINPVCVACRRVEALGYGMQSPPAQAMADYLFEDHQPVGGALLSVIGYRLSAIGYNKPSASQGEARIRGRERNHYSKTIRPWLCEAKPAFAGESRVITQRPSFRSSRGAHYSQERSTLSNRFNLCENCYDSSNL